MADFQLGSDQKARYRVQGGKAANVTSSDTASAGVVVDADAQPGYIASGYVWGQKVQTGVVLTALIQLEGKAAVRLTINIDVADGKVTPSTAATAQVDGFSFVLDPPEEKDRQQHQLEGSNL